MTALALIPPRVRSKAPGKRGLGAAEEDAMNTLSISLETHGVATVVRVAGRLSLEEAGRLRKVLEEAAKGRPGRVVVELSACPYIDTTGIATLVSALQAARQRGQGFLLVGMQEQVRSALELTRVDKVFDSRATLAEALAA